MSIRRLEAGMRQVAAGLVSLREPTAATLGQLANDLRSIRLDAIQFEHAEIIRAASEAETETQTLLTGKTHDRQRCIQAVHDLGRLLLAGLKAGAEQIDQETAQGGAVKPRLMVVDDSRVAAVALANAFSQHGFTVRSVATMNEAMGELRDFRPCVLVSDVYMPNLDLALICRTFRASSSDRCGSIILVSGSSGETLNVLLDSVRPDAFVPKMAGTQAVVDKVLEIWRKSQIHAPPSVSAPAGPTGDSAPSCDSGPKGAQ